MSSPGSSSEMIELEEFNRAAMAVGTAYRLECAPKDDVDQGLYVVLYLHHDHEDTLVVVEASGGTPGIVHIMTPEKDVGIGDPLFVAWQDGHGMGWKVEGMCIRILQGGERTIRKPLLEQLAKVAPALSSTGSTVVPLERHRRKGHPPTNS